MPESKPEKPLFLLVFRGPVDEADPSPEEMQEIFAKWIVWMKAMKAKGQYVAGDPLADGGKVLRGPRGATVTDGPYAEAKEIVGGYMIIRADNIAQAVESSRDCPGLELGRAVEVRPIEQLPPI